MRFLLVVLVVIPIGFHSAQGVPGVGFEGCLFWSVGMDYCKLQSPWFLTDSMIFYQGQVFQPTRSSARPLFPFRRTFM